MWGTKCPTNHRGLPDFPSTAAHMRSSGWADRSVVCAADLEDLEDEGEDEEPLFFWCRFSGEVRWLTFESFGMGPGCEPVSMTQCHPQFVVVVGNYLRQTGGGQQCCMAQCQLLDLLFQFWARPAWLADPCQPMTKQRQLGCHGE